jgi:hypothetical protein
MTQVPSYCRTEFVHSFQRIAFMARYDDLKNNLISLSHLTQVSPVLHPHHRALSYCATVVFSFNKLIVSQSFPIKKMKLLLFISVCFIN